MKKKYFLLLLFFCSVSSFAEVRTVDQAAQLAAEALNRNAAVGARRAPVSADGMQLYKVFYKQTLDIALDDAGRQEAAPVGRLQGQHRVAKAETLANLSQIVHIEHAAGEPALYVFNNDNGGFAVISADTRAVDVLCYSDTGTLNDATYNPALQFWINRYAEEISCLTDEEPDLAGEDNRSPVRRAAQAVTPIEPLLGGTIWKQQAPYNNACPLDCNSERSVVGCVALATAAIMRYHHYPTKGMGAYQYTCNFLNQSCSRELTVSFTNATYNYDLMLDAYNEGEYTTEQADAVAELCYHIGVMNDMQYSKAGSGSTTYTIPDKLARYMGYQSNGFYWLRNNSVELFNNAFNADLEAGRPILVSGADQTPGVGGHAWVCDGRDDKGYFHMNWGWGGYGNNYCVLSALTTTHTSGISVNFSNYIPSEVGFCYGLEPVHGTCGTNLTWHLSDDMRTLVIDGYGPMDNYNYGASTPIKAPWDSYRSIITSIQFPEGITTIGNHAFVYMTALTSVEIPKNVVTTGVQPFFGCSNLQSVQWNATACNLSANALANTPFYNIRTQITAFTIGENVERLPLGCCYGMTGLTEVVLPASMTLINGNSFQGCTGLTDVTVPASVTQINGKAFCDCTGLTSIRVEAATPPALPEADAFTNVSASIPVTVPCGYQSAYEAASVWSNFTNYNTFGDYPFTLTAGVQDAGTGTASVTTAPDCATNIATVTATPAAHYHFLRWADEDENDESVGAVRDVIVTADASCTAVFGEDPKYTLAINNDGNGTASADKDSYYEGETAVLTVAPNTHYHFAAWTGEDNGSISQTDATHYEYVVGTDNRTFTATFAQDYTGGNCEENGGTNLTWELNNGELIIAGNGTMEDYADAGEMPWYDYRDDITSTVITERADQTPLFRWLETQGSVNVTINRTLYADGYYNTLCLPFNLSPSQLSVSLPNASLFAFTNAAVVAGALELELAPQTTLVAGQPYLIRFPASDPDIVNPVFSGVHISASVGQSSGTGDVRFVGVLRPNMMTADNSAQLMVGGNNELYWADRNAAMRGFRAYFYIQTGNASPPRRGMPARVVERGQTPTAISDATATDNARKYIENGTLVIERNGKRYNAQGNMIN